MTIQLGDYPTVASAVSTFESRPWPGEHIEDYPPGEERNAYRASMALPALLAYSERIGGCMTPPGSGTDLGEAIQDLLGDLMHLIDLTGEDGPSFSYLADAAEHRYREEVRGE
jgi:hypothetical protein